MEGTWQQVIAGEATWALVCADCLDVLPQLPAGCVGAVVTDPPYGVGLVRKKMKQRDGSTVCRAGKYAFEDTPEYVRGSVVPAIAASIRLARSVAVTPGTRCLWLYPPADDVGCWYSAAGSGMGRWGFICCQPILYYGKDPYQINGGGARPNSCGQTYPNDSNAIAHPCAKPIRFGRWLVARASLAGDLVLDPFAGSGTTGVACLQTGRRFIGIEIDPHYCEIARKRLREAEAAPLFDRLEQNDLF